MIALGISALAILMAALLVFAVAKVSTRATTVRVCGRLAVLMCVEYYLASAGILAQWGRRPPPLMVVVLVCFVITAVLAFSELGRRMALQIPIAILIASQAFRLPLELFMHRAATDGLMPVQMSYSGYNFDILTGATAIAVAAAVFTDRAPRWLIVAWNAMGSALLINIVSIAVASLPMFKAFGDDRVNTWVARAPYVWLPGVLVPAALLGHLLIWRWIWATRER